MGNYNLREFKMKELILVCNLFVGLPAAFWVVFLGRRFISSMGQMQVHSLNLRFPSLTWRRSFLGPSQPRRGPARSVWPVDGGPCTAAKAASCWERPGAGARRQSYPGASGWGPSAQPPAVPEPSLPSFSPARAHGETSSEAGRGEEWQPDGRDGRYRGNKEGQESNTKVNED